MSKARKTRNPSRNNIEQRFIKQKRRNVLAKPGPRKVVIVLDGLKPNYNIGKIFRSADAFGIRKIHLIGIDLFDPAPAKGTFRSVPAIFDDNFASCHKTLSEEGYTFFVFTPQEGNSLQELELPEKSAFMFGHEEFGFSFPIDDYPDLHRAYVQQVGKVESLNVSITASIAMYEYSRRHP